MVVPHFFACCSPWPRATYNRYCENRSHMTWGTRYTRYKSTSTVFDHLWLCYMWSFQSWSFYTVCVIWPDVLHTVLQEHKYCIWPSLIVLHVIFSVLKFLYCLCYPASHLSLYVYFQSQWSWRVGDEHAGAQTVHKTDSKRRSPSQQGKLTA